MAKQAKRTKDDARVAYLDHRGKRLTVRLIVPNVSSDGRDIHPDAPVLARNVPHFPGRSFIVEGLLVPSTFEVEGIGGLRITFDLVKEHPLTDRLVVSHLEVTHTDPVTRLAWNLPDLPSIERLRSTAISLAAVVVRRTPGPLPGGATRHEFRPTPDMTPAERRKVEREWKRAYGKTEVIALASQVSEWDRAALEGKRRRDLPPWDSADALREVARHYTEAYRDGARPLKPIERHIADQTHRAPGTVRRQITEARKRGYIAESVSPRRATKAAGARKKGKSK